VIEPAGTWQAKHARKHRFAPWQLVLTGMLAGAAIFAAGATWFQPKTAQIPTQITVHLDKS
jgi:hypothetical protein